MTQFACMSDRTVQLVESPPSIVPVLPTKTYALKNSMELGLYLEEIESFTMPDKLFGSISQTAERVVNTFTERTGVTGVLLTGEKGSGKTLLGKKVALDLMEAYDMPIIVVNIPVSGDQFGIFLQKLGKPVTLFFDEFEKVYSHPENQNGLLTVLDGVYPIKMMAILTANDSSKMIAPLIDRPGRVYYKINYSGLEYAFVMEYAEERLKNKEHLAELSRLATMVNLNFDQLQALVEEMNRYGESVSEAVQLLNISMDTSGSRSLKVVRMMDQGKNIPAESWNSGYFYGSIMNLGDPEDEDSGIWFGYLSNLEEPMTISQYVHATRADTDDYDSWRRVREMFTRQIGYKDAGDRMPGKPNLIHFDNKARIEVNTGGQITLTNEKGQSVVLEKSITDYTKRF